MVRVRVRKRVRVTVSRVEGSGFRVKGVEGSG
jgi:hypothetical protein